MGIERNFENTSQANQPTLSMWSLCSVTDRKPKFQVGDSIFHPNLLD